MKNVMLDTETLGLRPGYAILSIAAIEFELDGQNDRQFYANIEPHSCVEAGLLRNPETMAWWSRQPDAAQKRLIESRQPLKDVLENFVTWWKDVRPTKVWCQGAAFDVPIVEAAMAAVGIEPPWKFWNVRDTRTLYDLADFDARTMNRAGEAHDATQDALFQIECVAAAYGKLRGTPAKAASEDLFGL